MNQLHHRTIEIVASRLSQRAHVVSTSSPAKYYYCDLSLRVSPMLSNWKRRAELKTSKIDISGQQICKEKPHPTQNSEARLGDYVYGHYLIV